MKKPFTFLVLSLVLLLDTSAQQATRVGNLVVTGNASFSGTLTLPDASLSIADTSGLQPALDAKQPQSEDLNVLSSFGEDIGLVVRVGSDSFELRTLNVPAAGITITHPAGIAGNPTLALANDLGALEGLSSTGFAARTGTDTWAQRTLIAPAAGITVTNGAGIAGNPTLALANDLAAVEGLASTGIAVRTGTDTWAQRTLAGTAPITVTNGDGVSGNPTIAISTGTNAAVGALRLATDAEAGALASTSVAVTPGGVGLALGAIAPPAEWIESDGATSGRGIFYPLGTRGNMASAAAVTFRIKFEPMAANPSATCWPFIVSPTGGNSGAWRLECYMTTAGDLRFSQVGAVNNVDFRELNHPAFRATYLASGGVLEATFTTGTSSPVFIWNGTNITAGFSVNNAGAIPDWLPSSMASTVLGAAQAWPAGTAPEVVAIYGTLTTAESAAWRTRGIIPQWVQLGGSAVRLSAATNSAAFGAGDSNTSAITGNTFNCTGSVESGARTGGAGAYFVRGTATGAGGANIGVSSNNLSELYLTSRGYWVRFWARSSVAQTIYVNLALNNSGTAGPAIVSVTTSWAQYAVFIPRNAVGFVSGNQLNFQFGNNAVGVTLDIDDLENFYAGALSLPRPQCIPVVDDVTSLGGNTGRLVGMRGVTPRRDWRIVAKTATSGNEQLLGGSLLHEISRDRITSWVINNLGTSRTVSLGNVSAGTAYASGITAGAGLTDVTLSTRFPAPLDFWVNSNGTDTLVHTISGQRVGNN